MAIEKERQTIVLNLLRQNVSLEVIVEATGLTLERIQELQNGDEMLVLVCGNGL